MGEPAIVSSDSPASAPSSPWLFSRRQDLGFLVLSPLLSVICLGLFLAVAGEAPMEATSTAYLFYVIFAVGFDNPHILHTFSRTHWDRTERERHPWQHWGLLAGVLALALAWPEYVATPAFQIFFAIFGLWHIYAQNAGFLKLYGRRDATSETVRRGERVFIFLLFNAYLTRVGVVELGRMDELEDFGALAVHALGWLNALFLLLTGLAAGRLAWGYFQEQKGKRLRLGPRLGLVAALTVSYVTNYLALAAVPVLVMLVLDTLYHDLQYLRWMAHYQSRTFSGKRVAIKWMAACLILGAAFEFGDRWGAELGLATPFTAVFIALTVYHYYIDGVIWKFHRQPELRSLLK